MTDVAEKDTSLQGGGDGFNLPRFLRRSFLAGYTGLMIGTTLFAHYWDYLNEGSGKVTTYFPSEKQPGIPVSSKIIVESFNAHHQQFLSGFKALNKKYNVTVLDEQEVTPKIAKGTHTAFPGATVVYSEASKQRGDYGNDMVFMDQQPRNVISQSIPGSSFPDSVINATLGAFQDIAHDSKKSVVASINDPISIDTSLENMKEGVQESRVITRATMLARSGSRLIKWGNYNVHVSGSPSVHDQQLNDIRRFVGDTTVPNEIEVICGDFNIDPPIQFQPKLQQLLGPLGFIVPKKTGDFARFNGDGCAYKGPPGATVTTLGFPTSDHAPVIFSLDLNSPQSISYTRKYPAKL